jgi:hypothetical protein
VSVVAAADGCKNNRPKSGEPLTLLLLPVFSPPSNMPTTTSLDRISQLKAEIASLEQAALQELMERRNALSREMAAVDAELAKLTGKPVEGKKTRSNATPSTGRNIPLQELKELLAAAPDKTVNIRKENLELRNIKNLAEVNPGLLKLGGKGAWPTVTLLK